MKKDFPNKISAKKFVIFSITITALTIFIGSAIPVRGFNQIEIDCWPSFGCVLNMATKSSYLGIAVDYPPSDVSICNSGYSPEVNSVTYYLTKKYVHSCTNDPNCLYAFGNNYFSTPGNYLLEAYVELTCCRGASSGGGGGSGDYKVNLSTSDYIEVINDPGVPSSEEPDEPPLGGAEPTMLCQPLSCFIKMDEGIEIYISGFSVSSVSQAKINGANAYSYICGGSLDKGLCFPASHFVQEGDYTVEMTVYGKRYPDGTEFETISLSKTFYVSGESYYNPEGVDVPAAGFMCALSQYGPWYNCEDLHNYGTVNEGTLVYFKDDESLPEYSLPGMHHEIKGRIWKKNDAIFDAGSTNIEDTLYYDGELHETAQTQVFYPSTEITLSLLTGTSVAYTLPRTHVVYITGTTGTEPGAGGFYIRWNEANPGN